MGQIQRPMPRISFPSASMRPFIRRRGLTREAVAGLALQSRMFASKLQANRRRASGSRA